ncbi:sigma-70 family RNA polymerase sigma factor [Brasilonema sp. UFV-L1]|uniref:sigma-70 family RNA polymerase sigma factor n=1 Tax=Brasilonema sp. UFV-L1 TaxID=2234130 RepID=UPI00145F9FE3|nr:sigma-70 family RNA polymerase sigma factor [Brasilonema sp. UFV-L1]NMG06695.1 sigma-70 family RNA polymerase sigma factor [Brasilonema sp. UFV-L1]
MTNDSQDRDDALNQELQQLINEAKQYPADSKNPHDRAKRRIALNKLINAVRCSGRLSKQTQWLGLPNYEDYYNEALQHTFIEICQKTEQYNPQYPVMAWVNKIFNSRFSDIVRKDQKRGITLLPKNQKKTYVLSLDEINRNLPVEHEISESEQLKEIIESDPENFFSEESLKEYPQANLKTILLLVLEGKQWKEISEELGVPISTASSFYQRRMRKIITCLNKYI